MQPDNERGLHAINDAAARRKAAIEAARKPDKSARMLMALAQFPLLIILLIWWWLG